MNEKRIRHIALVVLTALDMLCIMAGLALIWIITNLLQFVLVVNAIILLATFREIPKAVRSLIDYNKFIIDKAMKK